MNKIHLHRLDLNLLVTFQSLMMEQSVSRAAEKLGKTPSAVSHALGRLREQLGDPLMVNVGGIMQPSPYALDLIEEVGPILRSIQRAVQPPETFDPATSHRVFRLAIPAIPAVVTETFSRALALAPGISLEWVPATAQNYAKVAEGQIDIAMNPADTPLPSGISEHILNPMRRYTFARNDHPALANWNRTAWLKWPHAMVGMAGAARQTVEQRIAQIGVERRVGARIPDFSGLAPLLARTDLLANQVAVALSDGLELFGLRVLQPPIDLPDLTFRVYWSTRLAKDPGNMWLRRLVLESIQEVQQDSEARIKKVGVLPAGE